MAKYDYNVMPGQKWYGNGPGQFVDDDCVTYSEAVKSAKTMWQSGVRDIVINVYDLEAGELADIFYKVDDQSGKIVKR
jgi:hypothetical protein